MIATRPDSDAPRLYSIRETCERLHVCPKTLWGLRRAGRLRAVKIGTSIRFDATDIRRFIEASKEPSR